MNFIYNNYFLVAFLALVANFTVLLLSVKYEIIDEDDDEFSYICGIMVAGALLWFVEFPILLALALAYGIYRLVIYTIDLMEKRNE